MKQRLLLSLLMLFVSVGLVKAAVKITIPKGETATLTVTVIPNTDAPAVTIGTATTPAHTFNASGSYTVPKDDKAAQEIEISNTFSALTITGKATVLRVGNKAIETITASGIGLETLEIVYADGLKTLNVSDNALTSIDVSKATALKTLNISGNPGISMGMLPTSLESLDISGNKFSVANNEAWNLSSFTKLKELKLDGNLLVDVVLPADFEKNGGKLDAGTQDFTSVVKDTQHKANQNFNISTYDWGLGVAIESASDWKKQSGTSWVNASNEAHTIGAGNNVVYRFYDSSNNNVYTDGTYECVLTGKNGFKYKLRLTIAPAEFTIKKEAVANGTLTIKKGNNALNDGATVTQGDVLSIGVTPDANYEFVQFKDAKNLVLTNNSAWTKNPVECKVEGKFVSSSGEGDVVSIAAETKGEMATINYNTPAIETGSIIVEQIKEDGSPDPVNNNAQLPYGSKLQITLTPQLGYTTKLVINDEVQTLGTPNDKGQYVIEYTVEKNCEITAEFTKSTMVKLTAIKNGAAITGSFTVRQGTIEDDLDASGLKVALGRPCQVTFVLGTGEVLQQLRLNNTEVKKEDITMNTSASGNTYHFTFTPTEDVTIYLSTTKQQVITIKPEATEQTFVYDGKAKAFAFTTEPAGLESKVQVTYKSDADATAKVDAPIRVDRYLVEFAVKEDAQANYSIAPSFIFTDPDDNPYRVEITKATPTITTVPKVTISADKTEYVLSNDGKASVEGDFAVNEQSVISTTEAHMVTVTFTPDDTDNYGGTEVEVEVVPEGAEAKDRMAVNIESTLPEGIESVSLLNNGTASAKFGDKFVEGTTLIVLVKYAEGVDPDDIKLDKTLLTTGNVTPNSDFDDVASRIKGFTYMVPGGTQAETLDVQLSNAPTYTYSVILKTMDAVTYTGSPIAYDAQNITITGDKNDANATSINTNNTDYTVSYKLGNTAIEGNPVNAGDYTVCISIKAGNGYKAFYQEYTGKFSIDKATPKVTWPKVQPIAKGQKLKFAGFVGGGSNEISGEFEWLSPESTPKNGDMCKVKFVPDDLTNYEEVTKDDGLMVTVSDLQLITKYAKNGTITITDANGNTYESGTPVTEGTILKITATPDEDFELESLNVTGATNNGNGTYTVGETSVEVEATFSVKVLPGNFKVTIPEGGVRGAIITGGGQYVVAQGGSISFTVSTLSADANKVSVTATNGTVSKGSNGRYTVSNIQANTTVRVSLSNPTALKVDIKESYLNDKKYHIGYVEIADGEATTYYYGDEITVVAYPESGVKFKGWSNGSTDQVLDLTLTGDLTLTASFTGTPTGIEDIETAKVYTGKGFIMVKNVANAEVTVVSISGRLQAKREISGDTQITVPQGIYVVVLQSGNDTKQLKVIVK